MYESIPSMGRGGFGPPDAGDFPGAFPGAGAGADSHQHGQSLWSLIDDRMRGRWKWAILLALGLGLVLGVLGYFTGKPMFESVGVVRISTQPGIVATATPELDGFTKNYDRNVATQMQYMKGQRCLQEALQDEELAQLPFAKQDGAIRALRKGLTVAQDRDSEFVYVTYESEDPQIAATSVNAILRAYNHLYAKDGGGINATIEELSDIVKTKNRELDGLRAERQAMATKYDTGDLKTLDQANRVRISQLEEQIRIGKSIMQRMAALSGNSGVTQILPDESALDRLNSRLPALRAARDQAQNDFDEAKSR